MSSRRRARASIDLDGQADALVHGHRERLGAAHPAEPGGQRDRARGACRRSAGAPPRRTSRTCPAGCPGSRCRSRSRRSSGRTSSGPAARAPGSAPRSPTCRRGSSWRSARAAPTRGSAARRPACRLWTSSVSSSASARSSRTIASKAAQLAGRPAGAAVDDEVVGVLGDLRIEVVHQHPQGGFLRPAAAGQLGAARRADRTRAGIRGHARKATRSDPR